MSDANDPKATEEVAETKEDSSPKAKKARQWIYDRANGESKVGSSRPPLPMCWVPPCVKCLPDILEQNGCCEAVGKVGVVDPEDQKKRTVLMSIALLSNLIGMILSIISALAMSEDFDLVQTFGFSDGNVNRVGGTLEEFDDITIQIGIRVAALDNPNTIREQVVNFDEFCDFWDNGLDRYISPEDCAACTDVSTSLVVTLIMSIIIYLPRLFTDVLRMYPNYDVNCQKSFGIFTTLFSIAMSLYTWQGYINSCFASFYDGVVYFNENIEVIPEDTENPFLIVDFDWKAGTGLSLIVTATFLKIVDVICHLLIRTPTITRDRDEQAAYEREHAVLGASHDSVVPGPSEM